MQGRLLPKYQGRYQAHPVGVWQQEFYKAAALNLNCIEFILDANDVHLNPLMQDSGHEEILKLSEKTKVKVFTVCADYFMRWPLHHRDEKIAKQSQNVLKYLLLNGKIIGLTDIVIPCVDESSVCDKISQELLVKRLLPLVNEAEKYGINLSLETDLAPQPFAELLDCFDSTKVTVNYDTGNSAALGFEPKEEFSCYGKRISDIHIKDRVFNGGSVLLGTGSTKFKHFFVLLIP